ncbi:MAG: rhodanese-like domain-containing protein [Bacteroidia bacterium]
MKNITATQLKEQMDQGQEFEIIDVRESHEYEICHLASSRLIPMSKLMTSVDEIKGEKPVVMYCHHGNRSKAATAFLEKQRPEVAFLNLKGGIHAWAEEVDPNMPVY